MSSGLRCAASGCAVVRATPASCAIATIRNLAAAAFALSLIFFAATGYAQEITTQPRTLQRHSLLNLSKQVKVAAITHHQGGLPILLRLLLCHRRLCGLHDHHRMLCTGRRLYR